MVAERKFVDDRVRQVVELKKKVLLLRPQGNQSPYSSRIIPYTLRCVVYSTTQVCDGSNKGFVVINQKVSRYQNVFIVITLSQLSCIPYLVIAVLRLQ